jgi:hypothetical protein
VSLAVVIIAGFSALAHQLAGTGGRLFISAVIDSVATEP